MSLITLVADVLGYYHLLLLLYNAPLYSRLAVLFMCTIFSVLTSQKTFKVLIPLSHSCHNCVIDIMHQHYWMWVILKWPASFPAFVSQNNDFSNFSCSHATVIRLIKVFLRIVDAILREPCGWPPIFLCPCIVTLDFTLSCSVYILLFLFVMYLCMA